MTIYLIIMYGFETKILASESCSPYSAIHENYPQKSHQETLQKIMKTRMNKNTHWFSRKQI